jgi:hypothetical protein
MQRQRYGNEAGEDKLEVMSSLMAQGGLLASFLSFFLLLTITPAKQAAAGAIDAATLLIATLNSNKRRMDTYLSGT